MGWMEAAVWAGDVVWNEGLEQDPEDARVYDTRHAVLTPERELLVAVLINARDALRGTAPPTRGYHDRADYRAAKQRDHDEAVAWLYGARAPLPFQTVCEHLGISAERTRRAMLGMGAA